MIVNDKRSRVGWRVLGFLAFLPLACQVAPAVAYESNEMINARTELTICWLERRIIDRPPSEWIKAMNTECHQQENDFYRACRRLGRSTDICVDLLARKELDMFGVR